MTNGGTIRTIQAALGHAHATTTMIYLHAAEEPAKDMARLAALGGAARPTAPTAPSAAVTPGTPAGAPSRADQVRRMRRGPSRR